MRSELIVNLALILTVLTLFTGVVVALDKLVWKTSEEDDRQAPSGKHTLVEYSRSFFPVLLFVLVIRSFVFEPFRIPSGSMMPTLIEGDFIFVKKYAYGLRLPVTETKIIETGNPQRGDVLVFRLPSDPVYVEDLDGRVHDILVMSPEYSTRDNTYRVPEGHYFVMGDNRDRSKDSRFIGAIPEEYLVGEAVRVWMHFVPWNMPEWGRIGTKIQ